MSLCARLWSSRATWLLAVLLIAGCGGSGGGGSDTQAPVAQTGSLAVTVSGLPSGVDAAVIVAIGSITQSVVATRTLTGLTPGT